MDRISTTHVAATNTEQLRAWDGDEGHRWAEHADQLDRAVATYHRRLMQLATVGPADRVLDIGCGTGQTTLDAARRATDGHALGVDLSGPMLAVARARADAKGLANVEFAKVDAQVHPFEADGSDVVLSRTGAMFFGDPHAAFTNIARALRPGGRLALAAWQPATENEWFISITGALAAGRTLPPPPADAPGPFTLGDPVKVRALLTGAGFTTPEVEDLHAGMHFGDTAGHAYAFVLGLLGWMVADLDEERRRGALDALRRTLEAHESADGVVFGSAMWLVNATRR